MRHNDILSTSINEKFLCVALSDCLRESLMALTRGTQATHSLTPQGDGFVERCCLPILIVSVRNEGNYIRILKGGEDMLDTYVDNMWEAAIFPDI